MSATLKLALHLADDLAGMPRLCALSLIGAVLLSACGSGGNDEGSQASKKPDRTIAEQNLSQAEVEVPAAIEGELRKDPQAKIVGWQVRRFSCIAASKRLITCVGQYVPGQDYGGQYGLPPQDLRARIRFSTDDSGRYIMNWYPKTPVVY